MKILWAKRAAPAGEVRGVLEGVIEEYVRGWAVDHGHFGRRLRVKLVRGDGTDMWVTADKYRADLHKAGFGDGHHGFSVPLGRLAGTGGLRAFAEPSGQELEFSPMPDSIVPSAANAGSFRFALDPPHLSGTRLTGWIVDLRDPLVRCWVAVRQDHRVVAAAVASRYRCDLRLAGFDRLHGFLLDLPPAGRRRRKLIAVDTGTVVADIA